MKWWRRLPARALALALGFSGAARAEEGIIGLEYRAPAECPGREEFVAALAERTPRVRTAAIGAQGTLFVELAAAPNAVHGAILFREANGRQTERAVTGPSCPDVVEALALIASVLVDPVAKPEAPRAGTASGTEPPAASGAASPDTPDALPRAAEPPDVARAPSAEPAPAERASDEGEAAGEDEPATELAESSARGDVRWRFGGGAGAGLHGGLAPDATVGFSVEVTLERRRPRAFGLAIGLTLQHYESETVATTAGDADFALTAGRAWICPLRWAALGLATLAACGALEGGLHSGNGFNTLGGDSQQSFWLAPGLFGRAEVRPLAILALALDVGAVAPLFRPLYYFDTGVEAFEAPVIAGIVAVGVRLQAE